MKPLTVELFTATVIYGIFLTSDAIKTTAETYPPTPDWSQIPTVSPKETWFSPSVRFWISKKPSLETTFNDSYVRKFVNSSTPVLIEGEETFQTVFYAPRNTDPHFMAQPFNVCSVSTSSLKLRTLDWKPFPTNSIQYVHYICDSSCCDYFCCELNVINLKIFISALIFLCIPAAFLGMLWLCKRYSPVPYRRIMGPVLTEENDVGGYGYGHRRGSHLSTLVSTRQYNTDEAQELARLNESTKPLKLNILH